jgi:nucleoside-diphosphate-sugar epimerase
MSDSFGYEGVPVASTGAASGIGEATGRRLVGLGADIVGIDVKPISVDGARFLGVDLADLQAIELGVSQLGLASYVNGQVLWTDGGRTTAASVP